MNDREKALTPTMRRHLREMAAKPGEGLIWYPSGGELRSADALELRGLVRCVDHRLGAYALTDAGRALASGGSAA